MEIHALLANATEQQTSAPESAGSDFQEDDEAAKIELTYSTTAGISRVERARKADRVHNPGIMNEAYAQTDPGQG